MAQDSTSKKGAEPEKDPETENGPISDFGRGLGLSVLTDKQIEAYSIPKELLWYIAVKGEPVGPFHRDDLRAFLEENPSFPRDSKVANLVEQKWLPLFKIPEFQRRRPQLVPRAELLENKEFHLLKNGQKIGPYSLDFLLEKLDRKEFLFNDLISIDQGETWIKIFEHPHFDRRARELAGLPALPLLPDEKLFSFSQSEALEDLKEKLMQQDEEEGLFGLAYIGKLKSKTLPAPPNGNQGEEEYIKDKIGPSGAGSFLHIQVPRKNRWKYYGAALLVLLLGGGAFLNRKDKTSPWFFKGRTPATDESSLDPSEEEGEFDQNSSSPHSPPSEGPQFRRPRKPLRIPPSVLHPRYRPRSPLRPASVGHPAQNAGQGQSHTPPQADDEDGPAPLPYREIPGIESLDENPSLEEFTSHHPEEGNAPHSLRPMGRPSLKKKKKVFSPEREASPEDLSYTEEDLFDIDL